MMITERQGRILDKLVEEYILNARPISSQYLESKFNKEFSASTIRLEFKELTKNEYLEKCHISGGRIPTDKGYRFYVDRLIKEENFEDSKIDESDIFDLTRKLSELSSCFVGLYIKDGGMFYKDGWERVVSAPEFEDVSFLRDFAKSIEQLENEIIKDLYTEELSVLIGEETPLLNNDFSMILNENDDAIVTIIGPKRMNFRTNIGIMKQI